MSAKHTGLGPNGHALLANIAQSLSRAAADVSAGIDKMRPAFAGLGNALLNPGTLSGRTSSTLKSSVIHISKSVVQSDDARETRITLYEKGYRDRTYTVSLVYTGDPGLRNTAFVRVTQASAADLFPRVASTDATYGYHAVNTYKHFVAEMEAAVMARVKWLEEN